LDSASRDLQHIALATVAVQVLYGVSGQQVEGSRSAAMLVILNDVAHAISSVVPIYVGYDLTLPFKPLSPMELMGGQFERGAMIFRTKDGIELKHLTVQRGDMRVAISVLKAANATFGREPSRGTDTPDS
jgi:hypothetical protein